MSSFRESHASFIVRICPFTVLTARSTRPLRCDSPTGDPSGIASISVAVLTESFSVSIVGSWSLLNIILLYPSPLMSCAYLLDAFSSGPFLGTM